MYVKLIKIKSKDILDRLSNTEKLAFRLSGATRGNDLTTHSAIATYGKPAFTFDSKSFRVCLLN